MASPMITGNQFHSRCSQIARLFAWILYSKQASLAIADQAVISIGSIVLSVVIGRIAGIELLGSVGFILVLSVLGGVPVASLVSAPAMVLFGSMAEDAERYRGFLFVTAGSIGLLFAIALSFVYVVYRQRNGDAIPNGEICMVAFLFVIIPVQDTLRRAAFARSRAWAGLRLSVVRNIPPPIVLLWAFSVSRPMSLLDVVLVIAVANLASVAIDLVIDPPRMPDRQFSSHMLTRHWFVSRWLLLSSVFNSAYEQIFTIASGMVFGDRAVAAIRISQQAFGIILAGMQTFENTVPQQLALAAGEESHHYGSLVNLFAAVVFLGVIICGVPLWWFGSDLVRLVFNIDYREYADLLLFWAIAVACSGARSIYAMAFRATENTKPVFTADGCAFLMGAAIVIPILHWFGVVGSGLGMVITNVVGLVILVSLMRQTVQGSHERA